ncbi:MAG: site-specific integrase [Candidatus Limnocylindrales bacterium]
MGDRRVPLLTASISEETRGYLTASKAARTIRAYRCDVSDFEAWCHAHVRAPFPATPETIADYISAQADLGRSAATITRRLSAISQVHQMAGLESPTRSQLVRMTASGIRRSLGVAPRQARPILVAELRSMIELLPHDLRGLRDRALLLVGFAAGMRRSELVGLNVEDVIEEPGGLGVTIRRSKTDQEGQGRVVGIVRGSRGPLTDPVAAVREWRKAAGIDAGPLFRKVDRGERVGPRRLSDLAVTRIVKKAATTIGIDPNLVSGHSLRSGLATSASAAGAPERAIMNTTGHRSTAMVRRYIRQGSKFVDSASRYLLAL